MPINSPDVFDSIGDAILASGGGASTFVGLNDTPSSYSGSGDYLVAVNSGASGLVFIDANTVGRSTYTALNDTPANYTGSGGYLAAVNAGATAMEFIDPNTVGRSTFISLNDTPGSYSGSAQKVLTVNSGGTGVVFTTGIKASIDGQYIQYALRQAAFGSTGDHEGEIIKSFGSGSQTVGDVLYWNGTNWAQADASAESTASGLIGIATQTGNPGNGVLYQGFIQLAAAPGTAGDVLYLSETAGGLTATAPTTSGAIIRVMGYDMDGAGLIYFNPSADWLEIV